MLLAAATLQAMVRSSPVAHHRCYPQALQLLEYIHSESPPPGTEVEYVDLLVELKTRVSPAVRLTLWPSSYTLPYPLMHVSRCIVWQSLLKV